eukprot:gene13123-biopygen5001
MARSEAAGHAESEKVTHPRGRKSPGAWGHTASGVTGTAAPREHPCRLQVPRCAEAGVEKSDGEDPHRGRTVADTRAQGGAPYTAGQQRPSHTFTICAGDHPMMMMALRWPGGRLAGGTRHHHIITSHNHIYYLRG